MEKQFVNGLMAYQPHEKAPDFVKANLTIFRDDLIEWLKTQPEKIKVDIKVAKSGKWYPEVNTFKRSENSSDGWEGREQARSAVYGQDAPQGHTEANNDDLSSIPF